MYIHRVEAGCMYILMHIIVGFNSCHVDFPFMQSGELDCFKWRVRPSHSLSLSRTFVGNLVCLTIHFVYYTPLNLQLLNYLEVLYVLQCIHILQCNTADGGAINCKWGDCIHGFDIYKEV